jgi:hypothetical protein
MHRGSPSELKKPPLRTGREAAVRHLGGAVIAVAIALGAVALSQQAQVPPRASSGGLQVESSARNPWTHLKLVNEPDVFRFAMSAIRSASLLAAGQAAGFVAAKVAALTEGVARTMFGSKIKTALAVVLILGLVATGTAPTDPYVPN